MLRKKANLFIEHGDPDGSPSVASELGLATGACSGTDGIGGKLTLSPGALWFRGHAMNRVRPDFGIPLDEIRVVRDLSRGFSRLLEVELRSGARARFAVWGVPRVIAAINGARAAV